MTFPHKRKWQRMNLLPRDGETWPDFYKRCDNTGRPPSASASKPTSKGPPMPNNPDLAALSEAATKGEWEATERSGYHEILAPDDQCDWYGRPKCHAVLYGDTEIEESAANAAFIVALVNAYRSGDLVLIDREGMRERGKLALEAQMEAMDDETIPSSIHRDKGLVWLEGWFDLDAAIAAIMGEGE